nr:hypothetical protein CFP56_00239 [Quercus suber]
MLSQTEAMFSMTFVRFSSWTGYKLVGRPVRLLRNFYWPSRLLILQFHIHLVLESKSGAGGAMQMSDVCLKQENPTVERYKRSPSPVHVVTRLFQTSGSTLGQREVYRRRESYNPDLHQHPSTSLPSPGRTPENQDCSTPLPGR